MYLQYLLKSCPFQPFVSFVFDELDMNNIGEVNDNRIAVPTNEQMTEIISNDAARSYLFPKDRIIVDWVPYRAILANIPLFRWTPNRMKMLSDVSLSEEEQKGLLSICTTFATKDPPYASNMDIFGTDATSLKGHVVYHLRNIRQKTKGEVSLIVYVDKDFDMIELEHVIQSVGLKTRDWMVSTDPLRKYCKQCLYETFLV